MLSGCCPAVDCRRATCRIMPGVQRHSPAITSPSFNGIANGSSGIGSSRLRNSIAGGEKITLSVHAADRVQERARRLPPLRTNLRSRRRSECPRHGEDCVTMRMRRISPEAGDAASEKRRQRQEKRKFTIWRRIALTFVVSLCHLRRPEPKCLYPSHQPYFRQKARLISTSRPRCERPCAN